MKEAVPEERRRRSQRRGGGGPRGEEEVLLGSRGRLSWAETHHVTVYWFVVSQCLRLQNEDDSNGLQVN